MSHSVPISPHTRLNQAEGNGFVCTDFLQAPGARIPNHAHPAPMLLFVLSGSAYETFRTRTYEHSTCSVVFRPANEEHNHHYGNRGLRCLAIELNPALTSLVGDAGCALKQYACTRDSTLFALGLHLWRETRRQDSARFLAMEELLLTALNGLQNRPARSFDNSPPWLRRAYEMIQECFRDPITLSDIAGNAGVHPVYLADSFRKFYGSSIGKIIRQLRLNYAIDQLASSNRPLTELAIDTGFYDHAHFTHFVRRNTGLTPSELRRLTSSAPELI